MFVVIFTNVEFGMKCSFCNSLLNRPFIGTLAMNDPCHFSSCTFCYICFFDLCDAAETQKPLVQVIISYSSISKVYKSIFKSFLNKLLHRFNRMTTVSPYQMTFYLEMRIIILFFYSVSICFLYLKKFGCTFSNHSKSDSVDSVLFKNGRWLPKGAKQSESILHFILFGFQGEHSDC